MRGIPATSEPSSVFRATVLGDGSPGPIEERIGRRLLRLVDPCSMEGDRLLRAGLVDLLGPGGERLGKIRMEDAWRQLIRRLEKRLRSPDPQGEDLVREGLERLRSRAAAAPGRTRGLAEPRK